MDEIIFLSGSEDEGDQQERPFKFTRKHKDRNSTLEVKNKCLYIKKGVNKTSQRSKITEVVSCPAAADHSDDDSVDSMLRSQPVFKKKRSLPEPYVTELASNRCGSSTDPRNSCGSNKDDEKIKEHMHKTGKRNLIQEMDEEKCESELNVENIPTANKNSSNRPYKMKENKNDTIEIFDISDDEKDLTNTKDYLKTNGETNRKSGNYCNIIISLDDSEDESVISTKILGIADSRKENRMHMSDNDSVRSISKRLDCSQSSNISSPDESKPFTYPKLLDKSKCYEDKRAKYMLAFWKYARKKVQNSYDRKNLDHIVKKIVHLALCQYPIRSLEEYAIDPKAKDEISSQLKIGGLDYIVTPVGATDDNKYYSITEACLVAMISEIEKKLVVKGIDPLTLTAMNNDDLKALFQKKDMWMSFECLIPIIDSFLKPECPARLTKPREDDFGASYYTESSTRSAEFLQIAKLEIATTTRLNYSDSSWIKRHRLRGQLMYELMPLGFKTANMIRTRQFPSAKGHYRCSKIDKMSQVENKYKGICLCVDIHEFGGGANKIHEMCNKLDTYKVPFFVGSLSIGDYAFFCSKTENSDDINYLCPMLIERKSIEDIALSIHDGRWKKQKHRMYVGQYVFGYDKSKMVFIIEGKEERQQVSRGYIGHRRFNVDIDRLKEEIENLKSEGFEVLRTCSVGRTIHEVSRVTEQVAEEIREGKLVAEYTYQEFKDKCKMIPRGTDFSRLAKYAMSSRIENAADAPSTSEAPYTGTCSADSDSDIEILVSSSSSSALKRTKMPSAVTKMSHRFENNAPSTARKKSSSFSLSSTAKKRANVPSSAKNSPNQFENATPSTARKNTSSSFSFTSSASKRTKVTSSATKSPSATKIYTNAINNSEQLWVDYSSLPSTKLQQMCKDAGLPKSGLKAALIGRLNGPRPPLVWLNRKKKGQHVPERHNVAGTALLVALYLHEKDVNENDKGLTKEVLYVKAESLEITKNPFSGGTTQTGPYLYDGWSSMGALLRGDPPLVILKKNRYKLTRCSDIAGFPVAKAMHKWCHEHGNCQCGSSTID